MHIHPNTGLLIEPKVMSPPGLRGILQRKADFLQSERNKLVYLAQGNLKSTKEVSDCSQR